MTDRAARLRCSLWAVFLVLALLPLGGCRSNKPPSGKAVLTPEAAPYFQHLLPPSELTKTLDIELRGDHAVYRFRRGAALAEVELRHPSKCAAPDGPLCVMRGRIDGAGADALGARAHAALVSALKQSEDTPTWKVELPPAQRPRPREYWLLVGEGLLLVLIGGVFFALWRSRQRILSREAVLPAMLALLALVLRFIANPGPADIRAVLLNVGSRRAGWDAFLRLLYEVLPQQDETVWTLNRIVGALAVALLYVVLRKRFADPIVAIAGATALAVMPLLARFSASDTPYILLCAASLGALVAYDRYEESASIGALALALGLLTAAMQLRPDGLWLIVPAILLALAARTEARPRAWIPRPAVAACALLFVVINAVPMAWALMGHTEGGVVRNHFVLVGSIIGSPWADPETTPRALAALVVVGAFLAVYRRQRSGILWLAATLIALPLDAPATGKYANLSLHHGYAFAVPLDVPVLGHDKTVFHQYANARYHIPAMYLACGLAGIGTAGLLGFLAWLMRRRQIPAARFVAIGVLCVAALPRWDLLQRMWTPQREFEVFRENLSRLDPNCRIVTLTDVADAGFVPFDYLAPGVSVDIAEFLRHPPQEGCSVYYRSGNCFTLDLVPRSEWPNFELNPKCRAIEQGFRLEPIVEFQVAALPYRGEIYTRDPLRLGFYRLEKVPASDGRAGAASEH